MSTNKPEPKMSKTRTLLVNSFGEIPSPTPPEERPISATGPVPSPLTSQEDGLTTRKPVSSGPVAAQPQPPAVEPWMEAAKLKRENDALIKKAAKLEDEILAIGCKPMFHQPDSYAAQRAKEIMEERRQQEIDVLRNRIADLESLLAQHAPDAADKRNVVLVSTTTGVKTHHVVNEDGTFNAVPWKTEYPDAAMRGEK